VTPWKERQFWQALRPDLSGRSRHAKSPYLFSCAASGVMLQRASAAVAGFQSCCIYLLSARTGESDIQVKKRLVSLYLCATFQALPAAI
jgi:hypothetical protein